MERICGYKNKKTMHGERTDSINKNDYLNTADKREYLRSDKKGCQQSLISGLSTLFHRETALPNSDVQSFNLIERLP